MNTVPPYRVGRKQRRVILDSRGIEVAWFRPGEGQMAYEVCELLNKLFRDKYEPLEEHTEAQASHRSDD